MNSTTLGDAKEPIGRVESSTENDDDRKETIEQPTSSESVRASVRIDESRQNSNHFATESSRNDDVDDKVQISRKTSCDITSNKIQQRHKVSLKLVMRKLHMEDCSCSTLSNLVISRLRLPCKPSDLIGRIFEADPSLSESCLIVIKRKFQADVRNLCSCLNDVLEKLSVEFTNTSSRLYCDIRSGYISFKLKIDKVADKCPFVARVPICQNVHKRAMRNFVVSCDCDAYPKRVKASETRCSEQCKNECKNGDNNFCNTLVSINENSKVSNDTCCSGQAFVKSHVMVNTSKCKTENNSEKVTVSVIVRNNDSERTQDLTVSCRSNELDENTVEKEDSPDDSSNSIASLAKENTFCKSNLTSERNNARVSDNEEFDNSPQIRNDDDKRDWMIRSPDEELNRKNEDFAAATSSIASFVQHSENDKQLVELNCNCFSDNYSKAIDEQQSDPQDVDSTNVEIECDSDLSCLANNFLNITVADIIFDDVFEKRESRNDDATTNAGNCSGMTTKLSNNNLLATSIQTSRKLKVSSKGITVDVSCPQSVVCLASDDRNNISTVVKTYDRCDKKVDPAVCCCTTGDILSNVTKRENQTICDKIGFNISDGTRDFVQSQKRFPTLKERLGCYSNANLSDGFSTEDFYADNNSTYVASQSCRRFSYSTASEFATSRKRDKSQTAHRLQKSFRFRQRGRSTSSSSDIFRANSSFAATKHRRTSCRCQNDNYADDTRPQVIFVLTKFRNSVDRSLGKIKRLIHTKLDRVLFGNRIKTTNMWKTLWKNEESSEYMRQSRGKRRRQNYSVTSCSLSTSDYCKQGCVFSSESSDVTLSIIRNRSGERCEKAKFCGFAGSGEVLGSVRSIEALRSRDLLTPTLKNAEEQKSSERTVGKEKIKYRTNH
ncbi:uncharacterized protein LOC109861574 isoform X2 [Pseudomyrmex gracilis]|uniref:uncharacterized protein LOC109861574 isoform X2 n=1 Tax=Pseudomyrmex gracilis TaxID=219809 RepID=UPI000994CA22|nr:uncharacterized protein LOC109861574 isoform X2 [Pseudomyrmex gracilis]